MLETIENVLQIAYNKGILLGKNKNSKNIK